MTTVTGEIAVLLDVLGPPPGRRPDPRRRRLGRPHPRPTALVDGLSPTATRAEVTALLGTPERVGPGFDRYQVNERYLHFEFDQNGRTARITALLEPN